MVVSWRAAPLLRRLILGAEVAVALLLLSTGPAAAHTSLLSSDPSEGSTVARAPIEVALTFNEAVRPVSEAFRLYDRDGAQQVLPASAVNNTVTLQLPADISEGSYAISWRVISADSHPISGGLTFAVGRASDRPVVVPETDEELIRLIVVVLQGVGYLGVMLAIGLTVFRVWVLKGRAVADRRQLLAAASAAAILAYVLLVPLAQLRENDGELRSLLDPALWLSSWATPAGATLMLVTAGCVVILVGPTLPTARLRALAAGPPPPCAVCYHRRMTIQTVEGEGVNAPRLETAGLSPAASLFHSLSDPNRLAILRHLSLGEHRVVELVDHLGLAQSTVSKHLACLRDCGLVDSRPVGRASVFTLTTRAALLEVFAAAERLLVLTGDAVDLCPTYGAASRDGAAD